MINTDNLTPVADVAPGKSIVFLQPSDLLAAFAGIAPHLPVTRVVPGDEKLESRWFDGPTTPSAEVLDDPFPEVYAAITRALPGSNPDEPLLTMRSFGIPASSRAIDAYKASIRMVALTTASKRARTLPRMLVEEFGNAVDLTVTDVAPYDPNLAGADFTWRDLLLAPSVDGLPPAVQRILELSMADWTKVDWAAIAKIEPAQAPKVTPPLDTKDYLLAIYAARNEEATKYWVRLQPAFAAAAYILSTLPESESADAFKINGLSVNGFDNLRTQLIRPLLPALKALVECFGYTTISGTTHQMAVRYLSEEDREAAVTGLETAAVLQNRIDVLRSFYNRVSPLLHDPQVMAAWAQMDSAFGAAKPSMPTDLPHPQTSYVRPLVAGFSGFSSPTPGPAHFLHLVQRRVKLYAHEVIVDDTRLQVTSDFPLRPFVILRLDTANYSSIYGMEPLGVPQLPEHDFNKFRSPLFLRGELHRGRHLTIGDIGYSPLGHAVGLHLVDPAEWFKVGEPSIDSLSEQAYAALEVLTGNLRPSSSPKHAVPNRGLFHVRGGATALTESRSMGIQDVFDRFGVVLLPTVPTRALEKPVFPLTLADSVGGPLPSLIAKPSANLVSHQTIIVEMASDTVPLAVIGRDPGDVEWEDVEDGAAPIEKLHAVSRAFPEIMASQPRIDWALEVLVRDGMAQTFTLNLADVIRWV